MLQSFYDDDVRHKDYILKWGSNVMHINAIEVFNVVKSIVSTSASKQLLFQRIQICLFLNAATYTWRSFYAHTFKKWTEFVVKKLFTVWHNLTGNIWLSNIQFVIYEQKIC